MKVSRARINNRNVLNGMRTESYLAVFPLRFRLRDMNCAFMERERYAILSIALIFLVQQSIWMS